MNALEPKGVRLSETILLGVKLSSTTLDDAVQTITQAAKSKRSLSVAPLAMHSLVSGLKAPWLRYSLNQTDLTLADGLPVYLAARRRIKIERIRGHWLLERLLKECAAHSLSIYILGADQESLTTLAKILPERYKGLQIAGFQPGRYRQISDVEQDADIQLIKQSGARLVLVGLGSPRQELWMLQNRNSLSCPLIAVGGALDYESGKRKPPPLFVLHSGFEWFWRFCSDPLRLWRRYFIDGPFFLWYLCLDLGGIFQIVDPGEPPESLPNVG